MCAHVCMHVHVCRAGTSRLVLGPPGLPASGGRAGPRRSGSPRISKRGAQEREGRGPVHPLAVALPQHSGPQGNHGGLLRAPEWKEEAGWVGEESCWPRRLCDAGAKGQEEEEKAEQRRFFSGEWESREGRQPGEKKGRREIKRKMEETQAQQAGAGRGGVARLPQAFSL